MTFRDLLLNSSLTQPSQTIQVGSNGLMLELVIRTILVLLTVSRSSASLGLIAISIQFQSIINKVRLFWLSKIMLEGLSSASADFTVPTYYLSTRLKESLKIQPLITYISLCKELIRTTTSTLYQLILLKLTLRFCGHCKVLICIATLELFTMYSTSSLYRQSMICYLELEKL